MMISQKRYEELILGDIILPIPEMTRELVRGKEVVRLARKDGHEQLVPLADLKFLKQHVYQEGVN
jgi:hypothetical protein